MFKFIMPSFKIKVEKWKWNKEYRVYVSNMGHFKDEYKRNLPIKINQNGYCIVVDARGVYIKQAHRLVMLTWRPIPNAEEMTVDHLNHNKRDNSLDNLEWVSFFENQYRATRDQINTELACVAGITNGNITFLNAAEAADWILKKYPRQVNVQKEQVEEKINKYLDSNKRYFGWRWKTVKKEL